MLGLLNSSALRRRLQQGVAGPLFVGLVWRLIAAASGFGWFAIDDYLFAIEKAAQWQTDPQAAFDCAYRSTLVPRLMSWLLRLGHLCVGTDPAYALQVAYGVLGIASSASILATYHIARLGAGLRAARTSAWLVACYVIMPRICTRALLESICMLPVCLSVWALMQSSAEPQSAPHRRHLLAFASACLCGLGAMVRFQVGILMLPLALYAWRTGKWARLGAFLAGGLVACLAQGALDMAEGRPALSTPWRYVQYNMQHASQYGVSPIYTYVLQCVMLTLPPACLLLGPWAWARACRQNKLSFWLCLWFVAVHSLIAHKEDRFLFPILPLLLVLMGTALALEPHAQTSANRWPPRCYAFGRRLFWCVNTLGLVVCSLSDAQRNWTVPLLRIARATPPGQIRHLAVIEPDVVPSYYLDGRASWQGFADVASFYRATLQSKQQVDYVLLRAVPDAQAQTMLTDLGCGAPERFEGDLVDRLLVRVNRHNHRRAATTLLRCTPKSR